MKKKEIVPYVITIVILAIFLAFFIKSGLTDWFSENACKTMTNRVKSLYVNGLIIDKYLDEKSHLHETLIINNSEKKLMFIIPNDRSGLYSFVELGDSIFKEKESLECYIKRDSSLIRFEMNFGCK